MPKIRFTANAELKQGDGKGPRFEKDKVYLLPRDACDRWTRRNVAVDVPESTPAENDPAPRRRPVFAAEREEKPAASLVPPVVPAPGLSPSTSAADRAAAAKDTNP